MLNFFSPRAGNQLRQRLAAQAGEREVDDIGIAKKIKKERFDCVQRVGAAELEQNYTYSPYWVHHPQGFLAEQSILLKIEKVGQRVKRETVVGQHDFHRLILFVVQPGPRIFGEPSLVLPGNSYD